MHFPTLSSYGVPLVSRKKPLRASSVLEFLRPNTSNVTSGPSGHPSSGIDAISGHISSGGSPVFSYICSFCSELSIFTLLIITLDRLFTILVPFHLKIRLTFTSARVSMLIVWFFVLSIALTPFLPISYFEHFYGRSGVCLALHITPEPFPGFEYSLFIFLGVNMSACLLIVLAYAGMYIVALKTHRAADQNPENNAVRNRKESRLARRMVLIISTNLACYLPISILSIMALANVAIPAEVRPFSSQIAKSEPSSLD